jgi:DNA-binding transcriptional MerR regulator
MSTLYRVQEAAKLSGVAQSSIYSYTQLYSNYFSHHVNPPEGQPRMFTPQDVRLLAFIKRVWDEEKSHDNVVARIHSGEFEAFELQARAVRAGEEGTHAHEQPTLGLDVPQVRHFGSMLDLVANQVRAAHDRETGIVDENKRLHEIIGELQYKMGQAEGEMAALRSRLEQSERHRLGLGSIVLLLLAGVFLGVTVPMGFSILTTFLR